MDISAVLDWSSTGVLLFGTNYIQNSAAPIPDPLFTDPTNADYTLQPLSPAIDAGDDA